MRNDIDLFKNETSARLAMQFAMLLEDLVKAGHEVIKLTKGAPPYHEAFVLRELEEKASPYIRQIVASMKPEFIKDIEAVDERSIWRAFWERQESGGEATTIFAFLAELYGNRALA